MRALKQITTLSLLVILVACGAAQGTSGDDGSQDAGPGGDASAPVDTPSEGEPAGGEPSQGGGGFSEPDPGIPSEEEFLARLEPIIEQMAPPNSTEVRRSVEEELVLFVEYESSDSYETLDAHYAAVTPPAGMEGGGGPTDFPESSEYVWFGNDFQIGVTINGSQVTIGFLGIPPAS